MLSLSELALLIEATRAARKSYLAQSDELFKQLREYRDTEGVAEADLDGFSKSFCRACDLGAKSMDYGRLEQRLATIIEQETDKYLNK